MTMDARDFDDSREKLEADIFKRAVFWSYDDYADEEQITHLRDKFIAEAVGWLDRQEAITKKECRKRLGEINDFLDKAVKVAQTMEQAENETPKERIGETDAAEDEISNSDVRNVAYEIYQAGGWVDNGNEPNPPTSGIYKLLYRQTRIVEREYQAKVTQAWQERYKARIQLARNEKTIEKLKGRLENQAAYIRRINNDLDRCVMDGVRDVKEIEELEAQNAMLKEQVDSLTADVRKWADAANEQRLVAMEQTDRVQELTAERNEWKSECSKLTDKIGEITNEASELMKKQPYTFDVHDVPGSLRTVGRYIDELEAENDKLRRALGDAGTAKEA